MSEGKVGQMESEISVSMKYLTEAIVDTKDAAEGLSGKISCILAPAEPQPETSDKTIEKQSCELAGQINQQKTKVQKLVLFLRNISDRVQL